MVVGRDGKIVYRKAGSVNPKEMAVAIQTALNSAR